MLTTCLFCESNITEEHPYCDNVKCIIGYYNYIANSETSNSESIPSPIDEYKKRLRAEGRREGVLAASLWLMDEASHLFRKSDDCGAVALREAAVTLRRDSLESALSKYEEVKEKENSETK